VARVVAGVVGMRSGAGRRDAVPVAVMFAGTPLIMSLSARSLLWAGRP
jgi:hypothetical protein